MEISRISPLEAILAYRTFREFQRTEKGISYESLKESFKNSNFSEEKIKKSLEQLTNKKLLIKEKDFYLPSEKIKFLYTILG